MGVPNCPYDTTGVDLTLDRQLTIPTPDLPIAFDLRQGILAAFLESNSRKVEIDATGGFNLRPQQFVLGQTREVIKLPIIEGRRKLAAQIQGRSSFARCGLLVHFTAPTVHAGYEGTLTLEMINLGVYPIVLYPDVSICQLILHEVIGAVASNPSQFHGQVHPSGTSLE